MDNNTRASKSDLEQYGCRVRIRVDYLSVESEKTADSLYEKAREFLREACPVVPHTEIKRKATASQYVSRALGIE